MSERVIPATIFVDADDRLTDEEVLKGLEVTLPGTTVVKKVSGSAVIDGLDMEGVR